MSITQLENSMIESVDASKMTGTISNSCIPSVLPAMDGSALTGIAAGGTGKILQAVENVWQPERMNNNINDWVIMGPNATITPSSTSSKVLVFCNFHLTISQPAKRVGVNIIRNNTAAVASISNGTPLSSNNFGFNIWRGPEALYDTDIAPQIYALDAPSSTSAVTYELAVKCVDSTVHAYVGSGHAPAVTILMEVEG